MAEKAGSGGAKIMEGWRKNNWTAPYIHERTRPDKVELRLSMQSLIQPEILEEINNRLEIDIQKLSSQIQTVLALALSEEYVTNERLRYVLRLHKSDITSLLQSMCRQGFLVSDGYGRGTKYRLATNSSKANDATSGTNDATSEANDATSTYTVRRAGDNADDKNHGLSAEVRTLLKKKRLKQSEMEALIGEIAVEWLTVQQLTEILGRDKSYIRNRVIPSLILKGIIEREYPYVLNHPNQRYRIRH